MILEPYKFDSYANAFSFVVSYHDLDPMFYLTYVQPQP